MGVRAAQVGGLFRPAFDASRTKGGRRAPSYRLRGAASGGQVNTGTGVTLTTKTRCKGRKRFRLGTKANWRRILATFDGRYITSSTGSNPRVLSASADLVIDELYCELNGVTVRATQNGSTTITIPAGSNRTPIDSIAATAFGYASVIPAGTIGYWRIGYTQATGTTVAVYASNQRTTGEQVFQYDASANPGYDDVNGVGLMVAPPTPNATAMAFPTSTCGEPDAPCPAVGGVGDSIIDNSNGLPGDGEVGGEWFRNAVWMSGHPCFTFALAGTKVSDLAFDTSLLASYAPYYTHWVTEGGTNDFAAGVNYTTTLVNARTIWAALRAAAAPDAPGAQQVYQATILPKVQNTNAGFDGCVTTANQVPFNAQFDAGGYRDSFNNVLASEVTGGRLNGVIDVAAAVADPTNPHLFKALGRSTTLAANSAANATSLTLAAANLLFGDQVVVNDNGTLDTAITNVNAAPAGNVISLVAGLNAAHTAGASVTISATRSRDGTHLGQWSHFNDAAPVAKATMDTFQVAA